MLQLEQVVEDLEDFLQHSRLSCTQLLSHTGSLMEALLPAGISVDTRSRACIAAWHALQLGSFVVCADVPRRQALKKTADDLRESQKRKEASAGELRMRDKPCLKLLEDCPKPNPSAPKVMIGIW